MGPKDTGQVSRRGRRKPKPMSIQTSAAEATYYPATLVKDPLAPSRRYAVGEAWYWWLAVTSATPVVLSVTTGFAGKLDKLRAMRERLNDLQARADKHGYERPNDVAITSARSVLSASVAFPVQPERVVASAEGGVSVVFYENGHRASIESLNTGEALASVAGGPPETENSWLVTPKTIYATLSRICGHLGHPAE